MSGAVRAVVTCDGCGVWFTGHVELSVIAARGQAEMRGWAVGIRTPSGTDRDLCPECRGKRFGLLYSN